MKLLSKILLLALPLATSACISLDGVAIGGTDAANAYPIGKFRCDNGYKVVISYRGNDGAMLSFNNGKDTFVTGVDIKPAASGTLYVNNLGNLKWHEKNGSGILTYPDSKYRETKKLWDTSCTKY